MEIMKNTLTAIKDFPNYYIDKDGNIYNEKLHKLKFVERKSHICVNLKRNGNYCMHRVDKLLATAFIPNPNNYKYVAYKNKITTDISLDNLYWTSKTQDVQRIIAIECFDKDGNHIVTKSITEIKECYNELEYKNIKLAIKNHTLYNNCYWKAVKSIDEVCDPLSENIYDANYINNIENKILYENINTILKTNLNERQYNFIYLYYFEDYSSIDIAKMYNISSSRVMQIINRSLHILKNCKKLKALYEVL